MHTHHSPPFLFNSLYMSTLSLVLCVFQNVDGHVSQVWHVVSVSALTRLMLPLDRMYCFCVLNTVAWVVGPVAVDVGCVQWRSPGTLPHILGLWSEDSRANQVRLVGVTFRAYSLTLNSPHCMLSSNECMVYIFNNKTSLCYAPNI